MKKLGLSVLPALLLGAALAMPAAPASALVIQVPPPVASDFIFGETSLGPNGGQYSITDNSPFWYVTGFEVTNPLAGQVPVLTFQTNWDASATTLFGSPAFSYIDSVKGDFSNYIQTGGGFSNLFFFRLSDGQRVAVEFSRSRGPDRQHFEHPPTLHLDHDDPWICGHRLHGLSSEVKAGIGDRLIL